MNSKEFLSYQKYLDSETSLFRCWRWQGAHDNYGYGVFRKAKAHRIIFEHFVEPLIQGLTIDHVKARGCKFRDCYNPLHLEQVTSKTNILRGNTWSGINSRKTHCVKGHKLSKDNLEPYALKLGWRSCLTCIRTRDRNRKRKLRGIK